MPKYLPELSRPHWARWLAAAALAWLAAPLFSPFMWRFLMVEGIDMVAILAVGFWTYFIGLPLAGIGIVLLLLVTFIRYRQVADWPWWAWALAGAATGLTIILTIILPDIEGSLTEPGLLLLLSGPVPGLAAALIFRHILLARL